MELISQAALDRYLMGDRIAELMDRFSGAGDEGLTCQQWLRASAPKRMIFDRLYGDLLSPGKRRKVLDVGGGLTCFSRRLAMTHDYHLLDLLAHEGSQAGDAMEAEAARPFVKKMDWYRFEPDCEYDVVIANDLFPNVDQRLDLFLQKFLPVAAEIRLSLTYYNAPRFYLTRRLDADEVFCMLAWDGDMTARVMLKYQDRISDVDLRMFSRENVSVFPNGRDVCLVRLLADAAPKLAARREGQHA